MLDLTRPAGNSTGDARFDETLKRALQTAEITIRLTFPGEVRSANGHVDGHTVTWRSKMGESTEIRAVASGVDASSSPVVWIAIGAGVLVAVAASLLVLSRRRSRTPARESAPREAIAGADASVLPPAVLEPD